MLSNLVKEMAAAKISIESIAKVTGLHRNTVSNKLKGIGRFSVQEAMVIQKSFFPKIGLEYLFEDF